MPGSQARYLPFGGWRTEPTAGLTDRGYTGHKSNNLGSNDIGLIYMNARYYVVGLNRFASADTIVPDPADPQSYNRYSYVYNNPLRYTDPSGHSCSSPINEYERGWCQQQEQEMLNSTVIIEATIWYLDASYNLIEGTFIGHATLKDGGFLITHNHFAPSDIWGIDKVAIYDTDKQLLTSFNNVEIVKFEDAPETLALDFSGSGILGLVTHARGLHSAEFSANHSLLYEGQEVAQIDWDGSTSHINWTRIERVNSTGEVPSITLSNYAERGASGGGVFANGRHIGNNWERTAIVEVNTGNVLSQSSEAALNSALVVSP